MSLSDNSRGYEQTLCDNNMQLEELKFYINNITRCIGIVDFFIYKEIRSPVQQSYQVLYFLTSRLSTNQNIIQQASYLQTKPDQSTRPYIYNLHLHFTNSGILSTSEQYRTQFFSFLCLHQLNFPLQLITYSTTYFPSLMQY